MTSDSIETTKPFSSHHFKLLSSQLHDVLKSFKFRGEELFHDTFFSILEYPHGRTLWLRRRRNLSLKSEPVWHIIESCFVDEHQCTLHLNKYTPENFEHILKERGVSFSKDIPLEDQFDKFAKFRFYRRESKDDDHEYGRVRVDETLFGIILSFQVSSKVQWDNVVNYTTKLGLSKTPSKLMTFKNGGSVPEELFGRRQEILEREESDSSGSGSDEEWDSLVNAQSGTPPLGDPQFTDLSPEIVRARQLFR